MLVNYTSPSEIIPCKAESGVRATVEMPPDDGTEKKPYVTAVKIDAPFETVCLFGLNFEKQVLPAEASLVENSGRQYFPRQIVRTFTATQAKIMKECIETRKMNLPSRPNPKARENPAEPEFLPPQIIAIAEYIIFEQVVQSRQDPQGQPSVVTANDIKEALVTVQKKGK